MRPRERPCAGTLEAVPEPPSTSAMMGKQAQSTFGSRTLSLLKYLDAMNTTVPLILSPRPHLRRGWAHPAGTCTGTGLTPAASKPRLPHIWAGTEPAALPQVLSKFVPHRAILYVQVSMHTLHSGALACSLLHGVVLCCTALYFVARRCTLVHLLALCCTALYFVARCCVHPTWSQTRACTRTRACVARLDGLAMPSIASPGTTWHAVRPQIRPESMGLLKSCQVSRLFSLIS